LTAKREVEEETGICIGESEFCVPTKNLQDWKITNQYEIYALWRDRYAPLVTHNTEHVFGLCVPRTIPISLSAHEHVRYEWLPYQKAAERCFSPSNKEAILVLPEYM
jgi:dATP pyrophosphohydrolase